MGSTRVEIGFKPVSNNNGKKNLALPGSSMWVKALASCIVRKTELKIHVADGGSYVGFVTGLDEEWMQMTRTRGITPVWLSIAQITSIEDTGRRLQDAFPNKEDQEKVRNLFNALYNSARNTVAGR